MRAKRSRSASRTSEAAMAFITRGFPATPNARCPPRRRTATARYPTSKASWPTYHRKQSTGAAFQFAWTWTYVWLPGGASSTTGLQNVYRDFPRKACGTERSHSRPDPFLRPGISETPVPSALKRRAGQRSAMIAIRPLAPGNRMQAPLRNRLLPQGGWGGDTLRSLLCIWLSSFIPVLLAPANQADSYRRSRKSYRIISDSYNKRPQEHL